VASSNQNPQLLEFTLHVMHGQPKNSEKKQQDWFHDNYPPNQYPISNHAVCFRLIFPPDKVAHYWVCLFAITEQKYLQRP